MEDKYAFLDPMDNEWKDVMDGMRKTEQQWGAPFYIFHENLFGRNLNLLRKCLGGDVGIAYAMKANPWLAPAAAETADYIEVSTGGELRMCRAYGIPGGRIILDGVLRTEDMLRDALDMGVRRFGIDSAEQAGQIAEVCDELCGAGRLGADSVKLLLRLGSGGRFGMDREEAAQCIHICDKSKATKIVGLHYYPGTQRSEAGKLKRELEYFRQSLNGLCELPGAEISEIQFGCGVGFPYFTGEKREGYAAAVDEAARFAHELQKKFKVIYEAGRCAAASAGVYVTKVFQIKEREGKKILFCLGGTNHLRYPGGALGIRTPHIENLCVAPAGRTSGCMICGALCNEADVLARSAAVDEGVQRGDLLIFCGAGAYSATEAPNLFLSMEMPSVLVYNKMDNVYYPQDMRCLRGHASTYRLLDDRM